MKKLLLILLIASVVLISGCVNNRAVKTSENRGVTINSFTASPLQAYTGERVLFDLEVENIGGTTARNVQVDLFGVEGQWKDAFGNIIGDTQTKQIGTLRPPLTERNIPGDFKLVQWQLQTPTIPQGISPNLQVEARVTYDY